jgi:RES domain-containing protein
VRLPQVAERVSALGASPFERTAFRHVSGTSDPRSGIGARIHGGRWNPPESFSTLYLALTVETLVAEWMRAAARQGLAPEDFLPRTLVTLQVRLEAVVDLRKPHARKSVGLTDADITSINAAPCQTIGEAAHFLGHEGLLAPSATEVGDVLAIFLDNMKVDSRVDVISQRSVSTIDDFAS